MSSVFVTASDIIHGPEIAHAPPLYGTAPKSGQQADSLSFHLVYSDISVPMRDKTLLKGDLYIPAIATVVDLTRRWPCVLIRTPYDKNKVNPDLRNPGVYWTQNGYCCFIQDCRGRFKSEGVFYKYTGEAEDGYDTVEWIAIQSWCNGSVVTDGPSYLAHIQTSMALLRPPHLKAIMCNKGGFFNAHTSGVRNGGAYEARQWVWAIKNSRTACKDHVVRDALEQTERHFDTWLRRYPFVRGCSPLSATAEYESFIFDQVENADYNAYWKQVGLNTEEHLADFADVPCLFLSGWYDIYCRSTIDFFVHLSACKSSPMLLIMGPWQHVGAEGHVAGEVDFGVNALVTGNLAPNMYSLSRRWFDRWVEPATQGQPRRLTPEEKLAAAIRAAELQQSSPSSYSPAALDASPPPPGALTHSTSASDLSPRSPTDPLHPQQQLTSPFQLHTDPSLHSLSSQFNSALASPSSQLVTHHPRGPYTSFSHVTLSSPLPQSQLTALSALGPTIYVPPATMPRERLEPQQPLPPPVRYFRMGGGDGHKTSQGNMYHGGIWMQATSWPPPGTKNHFYYLARRSLELDRYEPANAAAASSPLPRSGSNLAHANVRRSEMGEQGRIGERHSAQHQQQQQQQQQGESDDGTSSSSPLSASSLFTQPWNAVLPAPSLLRSLDTSTTFPFDPRNPCPSIGGNVFSHSNILLSGAYDQVERKDHFLCQPPYMPLSSRRDVCVFRSPALTSKLEVTGMPLVHLFIASTAVDTDFTAKLIDEYPPSADYPQGFAMQITHGIRRVRYRESRSHSTLMEPGKVYRITIELYPTSNMFNIGHRMRLDISSSNFPHFDINMNTDDDFESKRYVVAENTVMHCAEFPSVLELPVQTRANLTQSSVEEA